MAGRAMQWVNTPVLMEALLRYEQNRLPRSMKLWVEQILDINPHKGLSNSRTKQTHH